MINNIKLLDTETYLVIWSDLVVVCWVGEGKRKHALLLQVCLVDTSEGTSDDGNTSQVSWLKSSVLS